MRGVIKALARSRCLGGSRGPSSLSFQGLPGLRGAWLHPHLCICGHDTTAWLNRLLAVPRAHPDSPGSGPHQEPSRHLPRYAGGFQKFDVDMSRGAVFNPQREWPQIHVSPLEPP